MLMVFLKDFYFDFCNKHQQSEKKSKIIHYANSICQVCYAIVWQVQQSKYGKSNNVSADAAFKSQSKREAINVSEASRKPAPGKAGVPGADPGFLERWFICIKVCVCGGGGGVLC